MKTVVKILSALLMLSAFPALAAYIEWIPTNKDNCKAYVGMEIESDHDVTGSWYGKCQGGYIEGEGDLTIFVHGEPKDISLSGTFKSGKLNGQGVIVTSELQKEGQFKNGMQNGLGSIKKRGDFYFKGNFVEGNANGKGSIVKKGGVRFEGNFIDGWLDNSHPWLRKMAGNRCENHLQTRYENYEKTYEYVNDSFMRFDFSRCNGVCSGVSIEAISTATSSTESFKKGSTDREAPPKRGERVMKEHFSIESRAVEGSLEVELISSSNGMSDPDIVKRRSWKLESSGDKTELWVTTYFKDESKHGGPRKVLWCAFGISKGAEPSMEESIGFIRDKLKACGSYHTYNSKSETDTTYQSIDLEMQGNNLIATDEIISKSVKSGETRKKHAVMTYPLSDLSPDVSVEVDSKGGQDGKVWYAVVSCLKDGNGATNQCINQKAERNINGKQETPSSTNRGKSFFAVCGGEGEAGRIAKSLTHAIKLAGGGAREEGNDSKVGDDEQRK